MSVRSARMPQAMKKPHLDSDRIARRIATNLRAWDSYVDNVEFKTYLNGDRHLMIDGQGRTFVVAVREVL